MKKAIVIRIKNKCLEVVSPFLLRGVAMHITDCSPTESLVINKKDFHYLTHSSFNVSYIDGQTIRGYFRECRLHKSRFDYIEDLLRDYCEYVTENKKHAERMRECVLKAMSYSHNQRKFYRMGVKNDFDSPIAQVLNNPALSEIIGIPSPEESIQEELALFLQFAWGEIYLYNMSRGLKSVDLQTFNSNKQIATYLIAKELDISYLIPYTRIVKISIDGHEKIGTLMDIAEGVSPERIDKEIRHCISPNLQMQFSQLNLLDLICRQRDHRPNRDANYNIVVSESGESESICAFDNDSPTSFFVSPKINFTTSAGTTAFVGSDGIIKRPFVCKETCDKILDLKPELTTMLLQNYLSNYQIRYLMKRINSLRKSIALAQEEKSVQFLLHDQWTYKTVSYELEYCANNNEVSYMYAYYQML